ncbi:MAG: preprotein translocase subunit SecE [Patescibacteria group bacterium]|jgi:preprotein translocase SecE subunit
MNVFKFLKGVNTELRNTRWYTGKELYNSTMMVILIAIILSLFLFGIDVLFQKLLLLVF